MKYFYFLLLGVILVNGQIPKPVLTKLEPTSGDNSGGSRVTVFGSSFSSFSSDIKCKFGNNPVTDAPFGLQEENGQTFVVCFTPSTNTMGAVQVSVSNDRGLTFSDTKLEYKFHAITPKVDDVSPTFINPVGGSVVSVTGRNLAPGFTPQCKFGNRLSHAIVFSSAKASCIIPDISMEGKLIPFSISNDGVTFSKETHILIAQVPRPKITAITPGSGAGNAGVVVTISGADIVITPQSSCRFGLAPPVPARLILSASDRDNNRIKATCVVPELVNRRNRPLVDVQLSNDGENFSNSLRFLYKLPIPWVESVTPNLTNREKSQIVTLKGKDFVATETLVCIFGEYPPTPARKIAENTVVCTSPTSDQPEQLRVVVSNDGSRYSNSLLFEITHASRVETVRVNAIAPPTITTVFPREGKLSPNREVTITGTGFVPSNRFKCKINGVFSNAYPVIFRNDQVVCLVPPRTAPHYSPVNSDVQVTNDDNTLSNTLYFRYTDPQEITLYSQYGTLE